MPNIIPRKTTFIENIKKHKGLLLIMLPSIIYLIINNYIPMFGVIIAFKKINYTKGILGSDWVGFKNFYYLFATNDAWIITRNTIGYNFTFIILNMIVPVAFAIMLNEIRQRMLPRIYQTTMLFPYFISMVVVSYLVFSFLSPDKGFINTAILPVLKIESISWYNESKYWPFIILIVYMWKNMGYNIIIYLAALSGIDKQYYEAMAIDGAGKWKQIRYISIPFLRPIIIVLALLAVGKIFRSDFGLFYQVPLQSGALFSTTNVIDTYVYRALIQTNDLGMASAAGFYQAMVGFVLVLLTNTLVRRFDSDSALF